MVMLGLQSLFAVILGRAAGASPESITTMVSMTLGS